MSGVSDLGINRPLRIALVDDHRLFRSGLRLLLSADPRFEVVSEAESGEDYLFQNIAADIVFMDIDMPGIGGVEATRRAVAADHETRIVALSMHGEQEFYLPMIEAGAKGFLLKTSELAEVTKAALQVYEGGTYFSPELMGALMEAMNNTQDEPWREALSEREAEVLPLVCQGLANHEIAERLFISKRTVDKHRANILAKTGCRNTASLVIYAVKNNLIKI